MSTDTILDKSPQFLSYPSDGLRIAIAKHPQTLGGHRIRLTFDDDVVAILRRGLAYPRIHVDGSMVNGLRIWCDEVGGMQPITGRGAGWTVTIPVRRLRGREASISNRPVPIEWERDEVGPVLLVPRPPDPLLPEKVLDKLPNSQVDPETIFQRADQRLEREMAKLGDLNGWDHQPDGGGLDDGVPIEPEIEPPPPPGPPQVLEVFQERVPIEIPPPTKDTEDLREALSMVNELIDQLGEQVVLSIDGQGRVRAQRRVVSYIDL